MKPHERDLLTIDDWRAALQDGADVVGLLHARRERIAGHGTPGAWISVVSATALTTRLQDLARAADGLSPQDRLARWPLWGVPFAVKDNIDAAGFDTTAACPAWRRPAASDATVVGRLLDAGAVLMGKTNLDQFATGLVGTRSPYGVPSSAFAADRVSGGSSSGSAVAVAHGEVAFALGTDTAGSGRIPAGFNHLVGLKPTPGRVSTAGVLPACRTLDCVSVFALTVDDAVTVLGHIEGPDPQDVYADFRPGPARLPAAPRIGVPTSPRLDAALGYDDAWASAIGRLEALGARLVPVDMAPLDEVAALLYEGPWVAERWLAVRPLLQHDPSALDPTVSSIIRRAEGFSAADAFAGLYALQRGRRAAATLWGGLDAMLVPTAPTHPRLAAVAADPIGVNAALGAYTNFVNLLGWAALAVPAGFTPAGLPFGVTLLGPGGSDVALAEFGRRWTSLTASTLGATRRAVGRPAAGALPASPATVPTLPIAVVGAHLSGLPLNGQLVERGAVLERATRTAPRYRLHALPGTTPPKPGLVRVAEGGAAIELEVWRMPAAQVGSFLALIPSPLGLGAIELEDGTHVHGFLCEGAALAGARDITAFGGWRAFLAQP